jgi:hypothetical protein
MPSVLYVFDLHGLALFLWFFPSSTTRKVPRGWEKWKRGDGMCKFYGGFGKNPKPV